MTITTFPAPAVLRPRSRRVVPAGAQQALVWLIVTVCVIGPLLPLVYASVRSKPIYLAGGVFTLEPYRQLFADPRYWLALRNSFVFAAITTTLAVSLGSLFAILCPRTPMRFGKVYGVLLLAPIVLP